MSSSSRSTSSVSRTWIAVLGFGWGVGPASPAGRPATPGLLLAAGSGGGTSGRSARGWARSRDIVVQCLFDVAQPQTGALGERRGADGGGLGSRRRGRAAGGQRSARPRRAEGRGRARESSRDECAPGRCRSRSGAADGRRRRGDGCGRPGPRRMHAAAAASRFSRGCWVAAELVLRVTHTPSESHSAAHRGRAAGGG